MKCLYTTQFDISSPHHDRFRDRKKRMEHVKWTDKIKNAVVLEIVGEGRIMLEFIKKRKRNWLGHWLRRNCLLKDALEQCPSIRNGVTSGQAFSLRADLTGEIRHWPLSDLGSEK